MDTERFRDNIDEHLDGEPDRAIYIDMDGDDANLVRGGANKEDVLAEATDLLAIAVFHLSMETRVNEDVIAEMVMNKSLGLRAESVEVNYDG